jgi:hypothetical protein
LVSCNKDPKENLAQLITNGGFPTTFVTANNGGNVTCAEVTSTTGCSFTYSSGKIDYYGGGGGTVDPITWTTDGTYVNWSSSVPVKIAVIVKGGNNAAVYFSGCDNCVTEGSGLSAPINPKNGKPYGLSNITFCYSTCEGGNGCQTAFARKSNEDFRKCFLDLGFSRWGWTNGPFWQGNSYDLDIYAGAGQCDINKGEKVGTLSVSFSTDGTATVSYEIYSGYGLSETHLYIGSDMLPLHNGNPTVAPGQYPLKHEDLNGASTDHYTVTGLPTSGPYWIIAHAVVCEESSD